MVHSKVGKRAGKADWKKAMGLHPDYPLSRRKGENRWCKKVNGEMYYFVGTAQEALDEWLREKDRIIAGKKKRPPPTAGGLTVGELCDAFLQHKDLQLDAQRISSRHRNNCEAAAVKLVEGFGKERPVLDLDPDDFSELLAKYIKGSGDKGRGPVSVGNFVRHVKMIFKFGVDNKKIIDAAGVVRPVSFGQFFRGPTKLELSAARERRGARTIPAKDLRLIIKAADVHLRAMILLGINCAFGNSDVGKLPVSALDLDAGWVTYPRPKTGLARRCPLWPETLVALKASLAERTQPKSKDDSELVFVTKYGAAWAKDTTDNPVSKEFRKLLDDAGMYRSGLGFNSLRHTHRTVADAVQDVPAIRAIMGHTGGHVESVYIGKLPDDCRLRAVADHVREWLYGKSSKGAKPAQDKPAKGAKKKPAAKTGKAPKLATSQADGPRLWIVG